jgi:hypothetical protein
MNPPEAKRETRPRRVVLRAQELAAGGRDPLEAWLASLHEAYAGAELSNQVQHTCPKWAFASLCQEGQVVGVQPGRCPKARDSSSAEYAMKALEHLRGDPSLATRPPRLKQIVFGKPDDTDYRRPNGEVEVLVTLWSAGLIRPEDPNG